MLNIIAIIDFAINVVNFFLGMYDRMKNNKNYKKHKKGKRKQKK